MIVSQVSTSANRTPRLTVSIERADDSQIGVIGINALRARAPSSDRNLEVHVATQLAKSKSRPEVPLAA
jgi:hypothetical protein